MELKNNSLINANEESFSSILATELQNELDSGDLNALLKILLSDIECEMYEELVFQGRSHFETSRGEMNFDAHRDGSEEKYTIEIKFTNKYGTYTTKVFKDMRFVDNTNRRHKIYKKKFVLYEHGWNAKVWKDILEAFGIEETGRLEIVADLEFFGKLKNKEGK